MHYSENLLHMRMWFPAARGALPRPRFGQCKTLASSRTDGDDSQKAHKDISPLELLFKPLDEVKEQLMGVEKAAATTEASLARINYHEDQEAAVNEQVNVEYNISYVYHALSSYFSRDNVALPGLAAYFEASSLEERFHAQELMNYQARRGGQVKLAQLSSPQVEFGDPQKGDAQHAMEVALSLEKLNFSKLHALFSSAEKHKDPQMMDFVESLLDDQVDDIKEVADYVSQLRRVGPGHGTWHFDRVIEDRAREKYDNARQLSLAVYP